MRQEAYCAALVPRRPLQHCTFAPAALLLLLHVTFTSRRSPSGSPLIAVSQRVHFARTPSLPPSRGRSQSVATPSKLRASLSHLRTRTTQPPPCRICFLLAPGLVAPHHATLQLTRATSWPTLPPSGANSSASAIATRFADTTTGKAVSKPAFRVSLSPLFHWTPPAPRSAASMKSESYPTNACGTIALFIKHVAD